MFSEQAIKHFDKLIDLLEDYYAGDYKHSVVGVTAIHEWGVEATVETHHCACCSNEREVESFTWADLGITEVKTHNPEGK